MSLDLIDGPKLKQILAAGVDNLVGHKEEVDALNVFPVPDGDTGTNMSLTFQAALREAEKATDDVANILERAAQGALMGARGNSGVIVSQFFRGFARAVGKVDKLGIPEIVRGIVGAANTAYQAVRKPVEGTILTVVREAGEKAQKLQGKEKDPIRFLEQVYKHAEEVLAKTPEMLPTLKQAGVVDAGGKGLLFFFQGVLAGLKGEAVVVRKAAPDEKKQLFARVEDDLDLDPENITFQYCTEFIVRGENMNLETIREDLEPHGDCLLVVGDEKTIKIHIHTNNPGLILDYAVHLGSLSEIDINNMVEQSQQRLEQLRRDQPPQANKEIGLVAVASGEGLQNIFRSLGVDEVISGGQTMNPSTEELYKAVMKVPAKQVIILPNNSNIVMTAGQVGELTDIPVAVVPSKFIPQGIAALMAFAPEESLVHNQEAMTRALSSVVTGEVTFAVRASSINGLEIQEGDIVGLKDGDITCKGKDASAVLLDLLSHCVEEEDSFITIYYGHDINEKEAESVLEKVQALYPDAEVELYYGGQPLYYYLFSVE
ncbi:DAK2 domain-containing protein [Capillibacterium thermochitinicola]|uniref:DAK2 domain-containing protein n=1 Tax=Capillibacterium thermochitinicola TaxID=2699427 RepID=A0A8J6LIV7_9FIRM|nr:DAK2 domain-containing protein [Capillibacterium thermochitinicola]MBA2133505.1 DAK2 domain-containing protein [Capillibacterium thermochitinicola]